MQRLTATFRAVFGQRIAHNGSPKSDERGSRVGPNILPLTCICLAVATLAMAVYAFGGRAGSSSTGTAAVFSPLRELPGLDGNMLSELLHASPGKEESATTKKDEGQARSDQSVGSTLSMGTCSGHCGGFGNKASHGPAPNPNPRPIGNKAAGARRRHDRRGAGANGSTGSDKCKARRHCGKHAPSSEQLDGGGHGTRPGSNPTPVPTTPTPGAPTTPTPTGGTPGPLQVPGGMPCPYAACSSSP